MESTSDLEDETTSGLEDESGMPRTELEITEDESENPIRTCRTKLRCNSDPEDGIAMPQGEIEDHFGPGGRNHLGPGSKSLRTWGEITSDLGRNCQR